MGRAAARRNSQKQPHAIKVGPLQEGKFFVLNLGGVSDFFHDIWGYLGISGDIWGYLGISGDKLLKCQGKIRPIRHRDFSMYNNCFFENWYQRSRDGDFHWIVQYCDVVKTASI